MGRKRPNILVIMGDQHRRDCIGAYGNQDVQTPHLDRLAHDGIRYDNCFCPYPVCTPSRYSFLSGRYVHEHGGWTNHCTPRPGIEMMPELLRTSGYRTKAVGKMHFTPTYLDVGFEEMLLAEQHGDGRWDDDYHRYLRKQGLLDYNDLEDQRPEYRARARNEYWDSFGALPSNLDEEHHSTTWIGAHAVDALRTWTGGGNMLMVSFIKPHHPHDPPQSWWERYNPDAIDLLPGWRSECLPRDVTFSSGYFEHTKLNETVMRRITAAYYANVSHMDEYIGRMLDVLYEQGLYDNTLILYTSDHGDYMGFHHMSLKGNYMYDPLVKIPLIIKYPHGELAGTVDDDLVSNIDVAPTILSVAGLDTPRMMHGLDLRGDLTGRACVFAECLHLNQVMVRSRAHKLLLADQPAECQFFDLASDPFEEHNLYDDPENQELIGIFKQAAVKWRGKQPDMTPYLDEEAAQISHPPLDRQAISRYFEVAFNALSGTD